MAEPEAFRHQTIDRHPDELMALIAEKALGLPICVRDLTVARNAHDRVRRRLQELVE